MKIIWHCVVCGKDEVHDEADTTEEWDNAYPPSPTSKQREYYQTLIGEDEDWDVWGAKCPDCKLGQV